MDSIHGKDMPYDKFGLKSIILLALTILLLNQNQVESKFCGYPFQALSRWFIPNHYNLDLYPDLMDNSHKGQVKIIINTIKPDDISNKYIIMHAGNNLQIDQVKLYRFEGRFRMETLENLPDELEIPLKDVCHDDQFEMLIIEIDTTKTDMQLQASFVISISFNGITHVNGKGLVRVGYNDSRALLSNKRLLYAKFDRFKAHFVFPCFDEARLKATIKLKLGNISIRENAYSTFYPLISEPQEDNQVGLEGVKTYEFLRTIPMSIHKFGFVIGALDADRIGRISDATTDKLTLYLAGVKGYQQPSGATKVLLHNVFRYLYDYMGARFPLKVVTIIAIPGIGKALESNMAGLIVVDGNRLLREYINIMNEEVIFVAEFIDLYIRQWIGFLITQGLDHDSWLFEALISWHKLNLTDKIHRSLVKYSLLYARRINSNALIDDARLDAKPLFVERDYHIDVNKQLDEYDIDGSATDKPRIKLDAISFVNHNNLAAVSPGSTGEGLISNWTIKRGEYTLSEAQKAKALGILGSYAQSCGDKWPDLLKRYMALYMGKIAHVHHFMKTIHDECNWQTQISKELFLNNPGYPLVKVTLLDSCAMVMSQERFLPDYSQSVIIPHSELDRRWVLPIDFIYGDYYAHWNKKSNFRLIDNNEDTTIYLPRNFNLYHPGSWVKLNIGGIGYYRILYSDKILTSVLNGVKFNIISDLDCFNLLDDSIAIVKSGKVGSYHLVQILRAMKGRVNEFIQERAIKAYRMLRKLYLQFDEINTGLRTLGIEIFGDTFMINGMTTTNILTEEGILARVQVYEQLAQIDFEPIIISSLEIYRSDHLSLLDRNLHTTILICVARHGSDEEFTQLLYYILSPQTQIPRDFIKNIVIALAYASQITRLEFTWFKIQELDEELQALFVITLLNSIEGQSFAISNVSAMLHEFYAKLRHDKFISFIIEYCIEVGNRTDICATDSKIREIVGQNGWVDIVTTVRETRRRNFFHQRLDYNKLILDDQSPNNL